MSDRISARDQFCEVYFCNLNFLLTINLFIEIRILKYSDIIMDAISFRIWTYANFLPGM